MPRGPLPPELLDFVRRPQLGVIATLRPDGSPHTVATWYDLEDDGTVLVNMDASRQRLGHMRNDPRVSLTVLEARNWYRHVSLLGRVVRIEDDPELADIDRLARHYVGRPHGTRDQPRVSAWMRPDTWYGWPVDAFPA